MPDNTNEHAQELRAELDAENKFIAELEKEVDSIKLRTEIQRKQEDKELGV